MVIALLAALAALLTGCAADAPQWQAETLPIVVEQPSPSTPALVRVPCPPLDPAISAEARRLTPLARVKEPDALTAALMGSEAAKNASLTRALLAYEACRNKP